jgi:hypothetical protein
MHANSRPLLSPTPHRRGAARFDDLDRLLALRDLYGAEASRQTSSAIFDEQLKDGAMFIMPIPSSLSLAR